MPLPTCLPIPDFSETSVNVPSPLLWNSIEGSPSKPDGEQFRSVIGERHTHALAHVLADSRLLRDIGECSVSVVVEQHRGLAFETGRRTVPADLTGEAGRLVLGRPLHVVDYEQVQISVVVVIKPTRADGPSLA